MKTNKIPLVVIAILCLQQLSAAASLMVIQGAPPEKLVVDRVVARIRQFSDSDPNDPLLSEAEKLYSDSYQRRIRDDLEREFHSRVIYEWQLQKKLEYIDRAFGETTVRDLRAQLRNQRPRTARWPWPLCKLSGC